MKRILILLLCTFAAFPLFAQQGDASSCVLPSMTVNRQRNVLKDQLWAELPKLELRVGYSGFPLTDVLNYGLNGLDFIKPERWEEGGLEDMYAPDEGATYLTGNFSAELSWHIRRWFTLAAGLYFDGISGSTVDPATGLVTSWDKGVSVSFVPTARFNWANFKNCRLYSSVAVGFTSSSGFKNVSFFVPAIQFTPFGFTAGRKLFFFGEYSLGSVYCGGLVGVGYRF